MIALIIQISKEKEVYSKKILYSLENRPHHTLHMSSPFVVKNFLPIPLSIRVSEAQQDIKPGLKAPISTFTCVNAMFSLHVKVSFQCQNISFHVYMYSMY